MVNTESFPDLAIADMVGTDFFYIRASANPAGLRDKRFSFSTLMRNLFGAADKPSARATLGIITGAATLDFPSIAANAKADLTITVPGAAVGDAVFLGLPAAPQAGLVFNAFVSGANTVTVRASNTSAAPVDAASATYRAIVINTI